MNPAAPIRVLIAEDEALLAQALADSLQRLWPQVQIVGIASNGLDAVTQALALRPDVAFFDIKMPGQSGLDAACELAEQWPPQQCLPLLVFVTAYDNYAIQAFEQAALDYVLKPANDARLQKTIERVQKRLLIDASLTEATSAQQPPRWIKAAAAPANPTPLSMIRATVGNQIKLIPLDDVIYISATDKYLNVVTANGEVLIRNSLKELMTQLNPERFWQIHRGTIVQIAAVRSAQRDAAGKISLNLHQRPEKLAVSRLFAPLFRAQ